MVTSISSDTGGIDNAAVGIVSQSVAVYTVESAVGICQNIPVLKTVCRGIGKREGERGA